ncbi:hypothetical protein AAY24_00100 [Sedimenticola thiotaurini]|uniref:L,D-TPase catalytic domain-containing protein n=1 Tax=Sedimenticola thiotaurini TaxID=1543721 RepID=A0A0F7K3X7_9GAMM|nr:hypothetical protein AAY24_00100 [Sedimenticola thiotaurini]
MLGLLFIPLLPAMAQEPGRTVDDVLALYADKVQRRLQPRFLFADVDWPPRQVSLVAFKDTRLMELWALSDSGWQHIKDYRVRAMSGRKGPKLKEGDRQVPEGEYRIELLNPNSAYHLSMKLDYPNEFDRQQAQQDGRSNLGGDIFIHGGGVSSGCLAIGNTAAEELFVLAAMIGQDNVSVLITPRDYRFRPLQSVSPDAPAWVDDLHAKIADRLRLFPLADKR